MKFRYDFKKNNLVISAYDKDGIKGVFVSLNGNGILLPLADADRFADALDNILESLDPSVT